MSCGSLGQLLGVVGQLSCCLLRPAWVLVFLGGQLSLVVVVSFQPGVVGVVVVVVGVVVVVVVGGSVGVGNLGVGV